MKNFDFQNMTNLVALDYGGRMFTACEGYDPKTKECNSKKMDVHGLFTYIKLLPNGSVIVVEDAHFKQQTERSLAQPLTQDELKEFHEICRDKGIALKLAPQSQAPKARHFTHGIQNKLDMSEFNKKDWATEFDLDISHGDADLHDAQAWWFFAMNKLDVKGDPIIARWKNFPKSFEDSSRRAEGLEWKDKTNLILNAERTWEYFRMGNIVKHGLSKELNSDIDMSPIGKFLYNKLDYIYDNVSPETRLVFGLTYRTDKGEIKKSLCFSDQGLAKAVVTKNEENILKYENERKFGGLKGDWNTDKIKDALLTSIASSLMDVWGNVRNRKGKDIPYPGWNFIEEYIFSPSPYHLRGGVPRSNQTHWGKRPYIRAMAWDEGVNLKEMSRADIVGYEEEIYKKWQKTHNKAMQEMFHLMQNMLCPDIDNREYKSEEMEVKESHQLELAFA